MSYYRYCRWHELEDSLRLGSMSYASLHMPHGAYSCLVVWICACEPLWPAPRRIKPASACGPVPRRHA
jgi:hypothetical protein